MPSVRRHRRAGEAVSEPNAAAYHCDDCAAGKSHQPATAYEREQQALRDRVETLEVSLTLTPLGVVSSRLDAALRRIEQLEAAMARQQAWTRPPAELCISCGTSFTTPEHARTHRCSP